MNTDQQQSLQVTHRFTASPERVFDAWLDPASVRKWLFKTDTGEMVRCDIDARVGGRFNVTERRDGEDVEHVGEYLEIDRPKRLSFTFAVPKYSPTYTTVVVEIAPDGDGSLLTLTHTNVDPEWKDNTVKGWTMILGNLEKALG